MGRICVGRQAVIGVNCVLRSGVTIGDGSVVSMQSFVNKDVEPGVFAGGKPAAEIKKLDGLVWGLPLFKNNKHGANHQPKSGESVPF